MSSRNVAEAGEERGPSEVPSTSRLLSAFGARLAPPSGASPPAIWLLVLVPSGHQLTGAHWKLEGRSGQHERAIRAAVPARPFPLPVPACVPPGRPCLLKTSAAPPGAVTRGPHRQPYPPASLLPLAGPHTPVPTGSGSVQALRREASEPALVGQLSGLNRLWRKSLHFANFRKPRSCVLLGPKAEHWWASWPPCSRMEETGQCPRSGQAAVPGAVSKSPGLPDGRPRPWPARSSPLPSAESQSPHSGSEAAGRGVSWLPAERTSCTLDSVSQGAWAR